MAGDHVPAAVMRDGGEYVLFLARENASAPWYPQEGFHGIFDISDGVVTLRCPNYADPSSPKTVRTSTSAERFEEQVTNA